MCEPNQDVSRLLVRPGDTPAQQTATTHLRFRMHILAIAYGSLASISAMLPIEVQQETEMEWGGWAVSVWSQGRHEVVFGHWRCCCTVLHRNPSTTLEVQLPRVSPGLPSTLEDMLAGRIAVRFRTTKSRKPHRSANEVRI